MLRSLKGNQNEPWVVCGDFNDVLLSDEKRGGGLAKIRRMVDFREALDDCNLKDLGFRGYKYTWSNKRLDGGFVEARLDRFVANDPWKIQYPEAAVSHLTASESDHLPILLSFQRKAVRSPSNFINFRFEAMWTRHEDCIGIIEGAWKKDHSVEEGESLCEKKLNSCKHDLREWNWNVFGHVQREIRQKTKALKEVQESENNANIQARLRCLKDELNELLTREELMWKQRSRALWLAEGDKNTSYFHKKANARWWRNNIKGLEDSNGVWQTSDEHLEQICVDFYSNLFSSQGSVEVENFLEGMEAKITQSMNEDLLADFTPEEVKVALNQIHPMKAPGPDGIPALFFQKYWGIVGSDVVAEVLDILKSGLMPAHLNHTHLALIPKVKSP